MNESDGVHGPVNEEVIASLFEKHHGPKVYSVRTGRIPSWYTDGMKYFYEVYKGKILSVTGYIDRESYYILGGAFVYEKWKKESGYFGQPFYKLMNAREVELKPNLPKIAGFKYTGPFSPEKNQQTYLEMMSKHYDIDPVDNKGIPEDMVNNFRERYLGAWGIRKENSDIESMAKSLGDWHSSTWWDVVKVQVLDTTTSLSTLNEPMIEDKDCCEKFRTEIEGVASAYLTKDTWKLFKSANCDKVKMWAEACEEWRHIDMHVSPPMKMAGDLFHRIMNQWRECEDE